MRRITTTALALTAVSALALTGCGRADTGASSGGANTASGTGTAATTGFPADSYIGIALPQKTSENWVLAESLFKDALTKNGFKGDVQFANNGASEQQNQIDGMVTKGAKVLVIGAVDGGQLSAQVKAAHDAGATVIAYDRLIKNTDAVDYYVAYDNRKVGQLQGQALLEGLKKKKANGPYNIELVAGSLDDANTQVFFDGAMDILKPEIDKGNLKVLSGQTSLQQAQTEGWKAENAQKRMDTILTSNYGTETLDGVLSPNDTLARAVITSAKSQGKPVPVVTGQDSEVESVKSILAGGPDAQYSTINKDTTKLVNATMDMVKALQKGEKPQVTDTTQYNNGVKVVPANLLEPVIVTHDNIKDAYKDDPIIGKLIK